MGELLKRWDNYLKKKYQYKFYPYNENFKAPDWRKYKVDDIPALVNVRNALASQGLKDPWLRNEVWRHNPALGKSALSNMGKMVFRGWKLGAVAALTLYFVNNTFFPEEHHDDHHGDHH